ncbi:MAG: LacI family DNA-binding transcriptional regulator [Albidovulum sp.]|nr:LacI family DNA-binding transcriptional regulator [Albidovulum sp.]
MTIRELADRAGLSVATVDRALNNRANIRQRNLDRIQEALSGLAEEVGLPVEQYNFHFLTGADPRFTQAQKSFVDTFIPVWRQNGVQLHFKMCGQSGDETAEMLNALSSETDGVILDVEDSAAVGSAVDRLIEMGIPVATVFADISNSKRNYYVGADNFAVGATAGFLMGVALQGTSEEIVLFVGSAFNRSLSEREMGFRAYLRENNPRIKVTEVIQSKFDAEESYELAKDFLTRSPSTTGIYGIGSQAEGIGRAIKELDLSNKITYIDHEIYPGAEWLLKEGIMRFSLTQDLNLAMRISVERLYGHYSGETSEAVTLTPVNIITKYNLTKNFVTS